MVSHLESTTELTKLRDLIKNFLKETDEFKVSDNDIQLTPEQETELDEAIKETYDPKKLTPHSEVLKMIHSWVEK